MSIDLTPKFDTASSDGTSGKLFDENALPKYADKRAPILIDFKNVNVHFADNKDNEGHAQKIDYKT